MRAIDIANKNAKKPESFGFHKSKEHEVNLSPKGKYNYSKKEAKYIKSKGGLKTEALEKAKK